MSRLSVRLFSVLVSLAMFSGMFPAAVTEAASARGGLTTPFGPFLQAKTQSNNYISSPVSSAALPKTSLVPSSTIAHAESTSTPFDIAKTGALNLSQSSCDATLDRTTGKTVVVDSTWTSGSYAIDDNSSTYWGGRVRGSGWIYVDFGASTPERLNRIKFVINTSGGYSPIRNYSVEYSSNATTWTAVYIGSVPTTAGQGYVEEQSWTAPTNAYRYWRLNIASVNGPWEPAITELEMFEPASCIAPPPPSVCDQTVDRTTDKDIVADSTWTAAVYATDNNPTTYWGGRVRGSGWIYVDFGADAPIQAGHIKFTINTNGGYSPIKDYDVQYSDDASTWTTIYSNTVPTSAGQGYVEEQTWSAPPTAYRYWRLNIRSVNGPWEPAISEMEIFQTRCDSSAPVLDSAQTHSPEGCNCQQPPAQPSTIKPVNTRTGNFWTSETDIAVQTPGPAIVWSRIYASQAISDTTQALGYGWQHSYAAHLITPSMPGGESGKVIIFSGKGNKLKFTDQGSGQYSAAPGVYSTLIQSGNIYTQTLENHQLLIFDGTTGRLTSLRDAHGQAVVLDYDTGVSPARLTSIHDAVLSSRALTLTYSLGRIASITDGSRTVSYTYSGSGDLASVTDVMGRTTTYTYQAHLLTKITNALNQDTERMTYDAYTSAGRVISQTLENGQTQQFLYLPATTIITTTGQDGRSSVEHYDYTADNALKSVSVNGQSILASRFDNSFSPSHVTDGNGYTSQTIYNSTGLPVAKTNALGQTTYMLYDSQNRPISTTNALGITSLWRYDSLGNVISTTLGITTTSAIRSTTLYTYSYDVRYTGDSLLHEMRAPSGVVTHYDYNSQDQLTFVTVGYGTALAQITAYGYDAIGRVISTTVGYGTALARTDLTVYNDDNTVASTTQNYKTPGTFNPAHPDENIITTYGYDGLGRQVWIRNALGQYDVTHYANSGRVDWTARAFQASGWSGGTLPSTPPSYSASTPDSNVATFYGYDGLGRTVLVTETGILTGTFNPSTLQFSGTTYRVTRTEYDTLSRPITTTLNYRPGVQPSADTNIQVVTYYDGNSNPIWQRDALGRWTKTEYDALNRPVKSIANYEDGLPLTGARDADVISAMHYDILGRVDRQTENYVDGTFSATEPITDRVTLFQYDTLGRTAITTRNAAPGLSNSALNRATTTSYDTSTGYVRGTQDTLGRWVSQQYDLLGQVTTTIQNCRDASSQAVATGCAFFNSSTPDKNVPNETHYDALGRAFETVDVLGHVTRTSFDGLGRAVAVTRNYVSGSSATADTNVTSSTSYDALGRAVTTTDALSHASSTDYNKLSQTVVLTDTAGRVTRMGYDGTGTLRWSKRNDGQLTVYGIDGLGRTITTDVNYQDGVVSPGEPVDQDLITRTVYDAAGRRVQTRTQTSPTAERITQFAYDNQDHLVAVTENATTGSCAVAPCNIVTQYAYDRVGNRTAIIDANGHVRRFSYDAANQTSTATDALGHTTTWDYDAAGRVTAQHDPRGSTYNVTYSYSGLDQQTEVQSPNLATSITAHYDALGRRSQLSDDTGNTNFSYDALGRITSVQAPTTGTVGYTYNAAGHRTELTYPDATSVEYSYWPDGRLHTVTQGATTLASYTYDNAGRLETTTRANGTVTTAAYDDTDRINDLHTTRSGTDINRFQYTVDRLGQRTAVTETLSSTRTISYAYDGLLRLVSATENPGTSYTYDYDDAGNRTGVWLNGTRVVTQTFNTANQVSGWTYDNAGNLTDDGTTTYTYDALNRLTSRGSVSYSYNGDGELVYDGTTRYTQDLVAPLSQILQTSQSSVTTDHLYGLDRLESSTSSGSTWYGYDALGSVRQTLSNTAVSLGVINYDPWGIAENGSITTFGFVGELQDASSGLVNLRARWYDPTNGRFTAHRWRTDESDDTIPYSHHPYQYGYSNPISWKDPTGKCAVRDWENWWNGKCDAVRAQLANHGITIGDPLDYLEGWTLSELETVMAGVEAFKKVVPEPDWTVEDFKSAVGRVNLDRVSSFWIGGAPAQSNSLTRDLFIADETFDFGKPEATIVHELAHLWDYNSGEALSKGMVERTSGSLSCPFPLCPEKFCDYDPGSGPANNERPARRYGEENRWEDWATAVEGAIYPETATYWRDDPASGKTRMEYVREQFNKSHSP